MYSDPLMLSGIQHFAFCPRQWALIHIEQQWNENVRTVEGDAFHQKAHHGEEQELRGDILLIRGLKVFSEKLGITGICDVVEFHRSYEGVSLPNHHGLWIPYPVEYKKGRPKENDADRLQLCAQAMCLEEMLSCKIDDGAFFYGEIRRREKIVFAEDLRAAVMKALDLMHYYYDKGITPKPHRTKACKACSLIGVCIPDTEQITAVEEYIQENIRDFREA